MKGPVLFLNYKTRLLFEVFMGIVFNIIIANSLFRDEPREWKGYLFSVCILVFISEGIFLFNKLISYKYPWHLETRRKVILLVIFTIIWFVIAVVVSYLFKPWIESGKPLDPKSYNISIILVVLFVSNYVVLLISYNYHQSMSYFQLENERLKQEKLKMDYMALQDQINPHFLFNNLSTLIAIIRSDPKEAIRFAENFSDVYRYVLQSKDSVSIKLKDELTFIKACLALQQERLGDGLKVNMEIDEKLLNYHLPPLSLQFVVENSVKHNIATLQTPLSIHIYTRNGRIVVSNNLNHKQSTYSTHTGLSNLQKRYGFLTDEQLLIEKTDQAFTVELPLINFDHGYQCNHSRG